MKKIAASICIFLIRGIRPLLGETHCPYPLSCGNYAINQFQNHSLWYALYKSLLRLFSCHPFTSTQKETNFL